MAVGTGVALLVALAATFATVVVVLVVAAVDVEAAVVAAVLLLAVVLLEPQALSSAALVSPIALRAAERSKNRRVSEPSCIILHLSSEENTLLGR